jgi:hypothetical protein
MRNNKAPGSDTQPIEFENFVESDRLMIVITEMFNVALQTGEVASEWKDFIIAVLHKKKILTDCNNYRGLSLIASVGKLLEKVIQFRGVELAELKAIPDSQFGFRSNCNTVDAMFISRLL